VPKRDHLSGDRYIGGVSPFHCAEAVLDEKVSCRNQPGEFVTVTPIPVTGNPKPHLISRSHIEWQNLTIRMQLRRFTRITNAFSKELSHLQAACALHFAWYNFCRVHSSLRVTPAMEAGIAGHAWSIEEIVSLRDRNAKIAA
jgi:hypothetical protein